MRKSAAAALCAAGFIFTNSLPAFAQGVLTMHRLSAALEAEAVGEAVAACAKQSYKVTAAIVDADGVTQAVLRGDGASMTTLGAARDKAYLMLGADRAADRTSAFGRRPGQAAACAGAGRRG